MPRQLRIQYERVIYLEGIGAINFGGAPSGRALGHTPRCTRQAKRIASGHGG